MKNFFTFYSLKKYTHRVLLHVSILWRNTLNFLECYRHLKSLPLQTVKMWSDWSIRWEGKCLLLLHKSYCALLYLRWCVNCWWFLLAVYCICIYFSFIDVYSRWITTVHGNKSFKCSWQFKMTKILLKQNLLIRTAWKLNCWYWFLFFFKREWTNRMNYDYIILYSVFIHVN